MGDQPAGVVEQVRRGRRDAGLVGVEHHRFAGTATDVQRFVEAKPKEHVVLSYRVPATAEGEKANLGFSLVFVGVTMSE